MLSKLFQGVFILYSSLLQRKDTPSMSCHQRHTHTADHPVLCSFLPAMVAQTSLPNIFLLPILWLLTTIAFCNIPILCTTASCRELSQYRPDCDSLLCQTFQRRCNAKTPDQGLQCSPLTASLPSSQPHSFPHLLTATNHILNHNYNSFKFVCLWTFSACVFVQHVHVWYLGYPRTGITDTSSLVDDGNWTQVLWNSRQCS